MNDEVYFLKRYSNNCVYSEFSDYSIEKNIGSLQFMESIFEEIVIDRYKIIMLPQSHYINLCELLNYFNLNKYESDFLALIAQTQSVYILYISIIESDLFEDYQKEKESLENLIDTLEKYLMNPKKELHSISFKFNKGGSKVIKNFFVVDDIYKSILKYYELDEANFFSRKERILLDLVNTFNYNKGNVYVKTKTVQYIVDFLNKNSNKISDNQALKFAGYFLNICQIPTKNNQNEILIYDDVESNLESIEYQNMRHYLNDRSNTSF